MYGQSIGDAEKQNIGCDASCMELCDEGGLIWPTKNIVIIGGIVIKFFELILSSKNTMKEHCKSCSSIKITLITIKTLINDAINESPSLNSSKGDCVSCSCNMNNSIVKPLMSTFFNVSAHTFIMTLNRKEMANKLIIKIVKELKKKIGAQIIQMLEITMKMH